ncbi:hypothetical protein [Streptomyces sp. NPDC017941]|uniref:hypothetical protein n=1 Tax=Streptomyces sp. NPDC017941 TaxID=3365018 RepID=UPI0037A2DB9B
MGRVHDGGTERAVAAYEAALKASRVAAAAAGAGELGENAALNAAADEAEAAASCSARG